MPVWHTCAQVLALSHTHIWEALSLWNPCLTVKSWRNSTPTLHWLFPAVEISMRLGVCVQARVGKGDTSSHPCEETWNQLMRRIGLTHTRTHASISSDMGHHDQWPMLFCKALSSKSHWIKASAKCINVNVSFLVQSGTFPQSMLTTKIKWVIDLFNDILKMDEFTLPHR